ncbi:ABC transporter permease [Streptomyces meridianus]|uniref:ABC transporter permease n=1 Tax=Streptomyces meridianus TaxID=2938945 RepID=A0ABT0XC74_9ACTN|nr:ABC transporter permease [Streptomyces meridianus]MCM2580019.1 ABC transporter permease [Streptomyces meridianus]
MTGIGSRRNGTARPRPDSGSVPWIRTRLRAGRVPALALGVLVLVTAFLAAALPRSVDRYENAALRTVLTGAEAHQRRVDVTAEFHRRDAAAGAAAVPSPAELAATAQALHTAAGPSLPLDTAAAVHGLRNADAATVNDPGLPMPSRRVPEVTLLAQQGELRSHVRLISGRMPSGRARADADDEAVEGVVTAATAEKMHLEAGSVIHPVVGRTGRLPVRVTGIVEPRAPRAPYWHAEPDVDRAGLQAVPSGNGPPTYYWHFSVLIGDADRDVLPRFTGGALAYWHHPLETGGVAARDVPALRRALTSLAGGEANSVLRVLAPVPGLAVDGEAVGTLLRDFERERRSAVPLVQIAVVGVATVAVIVLLLAGALAATGRAAELGLLRARGAGLPGLGLRLLGETAAVAVPSAAAGTLLALALVTTERYLTAVVLGAAVAATASAALPIRAVLAHHRPRVAGRDDVAAVRPSRRRTVAELTLAALAAAALAAQWSRGPSAGADLLTAAAPVLLATVAAVVLLRLYPLPLRLLVRWTARLRGAVVHLALARAARAGAVTAMPLLAVLVAFTVASFGGSVLAGIAAGREHAATASVGADVRIRAFTVFPDGFTDRVRRIDGVRDVAVVRTEFGLSTDNFSTPPLTLVAVDPASYARLVHRLGPDGDPPFPGAVLSRSGGEDALPAVVSPGLARVIGARGQVTVEAQSGPTLVRAVAVRSATPATTGDFAVVSAEALARAHPDMRGTDFLAPNAVHITGARADTGALRALARGGEGLAVDVRAEERAGYGSGSLQSGAQRVYVAAVAAGAGYSIIALLLAQLQEAPRRRALLSGLRAVGMTRRQARSLVTLEPLPQVVVATAGGVLTGLAAVPLLRGGVDVTALAFGADVLPPEVAGTTAVLVPDPLSFVLPAVVLPAAVCAMASAQARWSARRATAGELRTGEQT